MMRYNKLVYIKEKLDNNTYIVIEHDTHKQIDHPVHSDRLKRYYNEKDIFPKTVERGEIMSDTEEESDSSDSKNKTEKKPVEGTSLQKRSKREKRSKIEQTKNSEKKVTKHEDVNEKIENEFETSSETSETENKEDERTWQAAEKL